MFKNVAGKFWVCLFLTLVLQTRGVFAADYFTLAYNCSEENSQMLSTGVSEIYSDFEDYYTFVNEVIPFRSRVNFKQQVFYYNSGYEYNAVCGSWGSGESYSVSVLPFLPHYPDMTDGFQGPWHYTEEEDWLDGPALSAMSQRDKQTCATSAVMAGIYWMTDYAVSSESNLEIVEKMAKMTFLYLKSFGDVTVSYSDCEITLHNPIYDEW